MTFGNIMPSMTAENEAQSPENGLNHLQLFIQGEYLKEAKEGVTALLDTFEEVLKEETNNAKNSGESGTGALQDRFKKIVSTVGTQPYVRLTNVLK